MNAAELHSFLMTCSQEEKNALKGIYPNLSRAELAVIVRGSHIILMRIFYRIR